VGKDWWGFISTCGLNFSSVADTASGTVAPTAKAKLIELSFLCERFEAVRKRFEEEHFRGF